MVQCLESPIQVPTLQPLTFDLNQLNQTFEDAHPRDILAWCVEHIPTGLVQTSAFGILAITDILYQDLQPTTPIPVLFLDTLHHFPETLAFVQQTTAFYQLDLRIYSTLDVNSREAFAAQYGQALWQKDIEQFHYLTKIEPLQRGLSQLNTVAWITGRRRDQAVTRSQMPVFELDRHCRLKVNPLANWDRKQLWRYVFEHNVPYNPLLDQGYTSIGDQPLTTPVHADEDERAGRWRGSDKMECGIHV
ncbi:MAG: phosphoadenosine phosphosulfate reductase [Cyanothece sp. SIO1E1]|nr:phosphoadenosine phosphosulfate reductase [Cyanothece sp. SIO1E1]